MADPCLKFHTSYHSHTCSCLQTLVQFFLHFVTLLCCFHPFDHCKASRSVSCIFGFSVSKPFILPGRQAGGVMGGAQAKCPHFVRQREPDTPFGGNTQTFVDLPHIARHMTQIFSYSFWCTPSKNGFCVVKTLEIKLRCPLL